MRVVCAARAARIDQPSNHGAAAAVQLLVPGQRRGHHGQKAQLMRHGCFSNRSGGRLVEDADDVASVVSQAPIRRLEPAPLRGHVAAPIETRHPIPAALLERRNERPLGLGVARAFTWKDRDRRNPFREEFVAAALDAEYRATSLDRYVFGVFTETFV